MFARVKGIRDYLILEPGSEHHTTKWIRSCYEPKWQGLQLQHFYRALDFIYHHKQDIEKDLFFKPANLFNQELDLVMFDTTSLKYWGESEDAVREIKAIKLTEGRKEIIFRTEFPDKAHLAFKAIGTAPPPRIISYQESESAVVRQAHHIVSRQG
jgi:hypothetical protein